MQPGVDRIFNVFIGHTAAGFQIAQYRHAPVQFLQEAHQIGLGMGDLHVWTQRFQLVGWQLKIELATQIENGLRTNVAVKVAMDIGKR